MAIRGRGGVAILMLVLAVRAFVAKDKRREQSKSELSLDTKGTLAGKGTVIRKPDSQGITARIYRTPDALLLQSRFKDFPYTSEFFHGTAEHFDATMMVLPVRRIAAVEEEFSVLALGTISKVTMDNGEAFNIKAPGAVRRAIAEAKGTS